MARIPKSATASEILKIISKPWLGTKDIQLIACVGENVARKIKENIGNKLLEEGYFLPNGLVPSDKAVEYLNINIKYLQKISN